jgi:hypothetical protein
MADETKSPGGRPIGVAQGAGPAAGETTDNVTPHPAARGTERDSTNQGPHQEEAGMRS